MPAFVPVPSYLGDLAAAARLDQLSGSVITHTPGGIISMRIKTMRKRRLFLKKKGEYIYIASLARRFRRVE